jgi:hypothetical protein
MPQPQLKQDYVVMTVSCGSCQQEQLVHVQVGTWTWSMAHQSLECLRCGQHFEVMLPDAIIAGPFLPRDISSAQ